MPQTKLRMKLEEPQKILNRYTSPFGGIDYGTTGRILAEVIEGNMIKTRLVWFKGHSSTAAGVRGFGQVYNPCQLVFLNANGLTNSPILEGGRLTQARLGDVRKEIENALGKEAFEMLHHRKTLVITDR